MKTSRAERSGSIGGVLRRQFGDPYNFFFFSLILLIFLEPYLENSRLPLLPLLFLFLMLAILKALKPRRSLFAVCLVLAFIASPLDFLNISRLIETGRAVSYWSELASLCAYIVFMMIVIIVLLGRIFSEKVVTADTVRGGLSIYFLMGIFWSFVFGLLLVLNPAAIRLPGGSGSASSELLYYSFVTMTTLGYGDITPVSGVARSLAIMEATLGQIFITVFIARLVGLHLRQTEQ